VGISRMMMEGMIREHGRKPYFGKAYTYGRQTTPVNPEEAVALFSALNVPSAITGPSKLQIETRTGWSVEHAEARAITDTDFFRMLGLSESHAIDVNDFEGADIILDLNQPIPSELEASCGLLVDGSLLDNVFDPVTGLKNAGRLLQPGGRCFLLNLSSTTNDYTGIGYLIFNAIWFFDYFVWNEFDYCQVYTNVHHPHEPTGACYAISYDHASRRRGSGLIKPILDDTVSFVEVYAEKGVRSTWDRIPTQHAYRNDDDWARYSSIVDGYQAQNRPYLELGGSGTVPPSYPEGYVRVFPDGSALETG
jgi:hypothetical protein